MKSATRAATVALVIVLAVVLVAAAPRMLDGIQLATGWGLPARTAPLLLIVSHHGDLDAYPEDTAEAVLAAAALQPDGIEIDIHRSASGTWWVLHDPTLDRTTNGTGRISDLSDEVIEAAVVDAGLGFSPEAGSQIGIPRLESVLADLGDFQGSIYLDLQHAETGDAGELVALTQGTPIVVICRSAADAAAVKAQDPEVETLLHIAYPASANVDGLLADANLQSSPRLMAAWSLPVTVYVEETQFDQDEYAQLRRAWKSGVKAYITNHVAAAMSWRDAFVLKEP
jgi:glycerophosphoryl diester phosphodiesterase